MTPRDNPTHQRATIQVCISCRQRTASGDDAEAGSRLADATIEAARRDARIRVQRVRCLANCSRGPSAVIRSTDGWAYVFGSLQAGQDAPALVAGAGLLAEAEDGLMPWKQRPDCLKRGLIARIPPAHFEES